MMVKDNTLIKDQPLGNIRIISTKKDIDIVSEPSVYISPDDNFFIHNKPLDVHKFSDSHKISRKKSYQIMAIKKKFKLLAGKASYVCGCPKGNNHIVLTSDKRGSSSTYGTLKCGSIYQCNTCQQTVLSKRKLELEAIAKQHLLTGGGIYLATLTIKHSVQDSLNDLLGSSKTKTGILGAYSSHLSKDRKFKKLMDKFGIVMSCRVFEVTYGSNGYHAHIHANFYTRIKLSEKQLLQFQSQFYKLWNMSVKKVGLECIEKRGVKVTDASQSSGYLTKYSNSDELTSNHIKQAKNGNFTINQLEQLLLDDTQIVMPVDKLKSVLKQYYKYCYSKRFLTWSDRTGLKKNYLDEAKIEEQTDEDLLESSDVVEKEKILIGNSTYKNIYLKHQVANLKTIFELGSFDGVLSLANSISVSTSDIHYINDSDLTEEQKLKKIDYYIQEFGFFPDFGDDFDKRDYYVLNYINLLITALDYYSDTTSLAQNNAYYVYVIHFCRQYVDNVLINSLCTLEL